MSIRRAITRLLIFTLATVWIFGGWPHMQLHTLQFPASVEIAHAAVPVIEGSQATSSNGSTTNSFTMTAPAGITAGELLIIIVGSDDNGTGDEFSTAASGWTKIGEGGNGTSDAHIGAFWKEAVGGDGNITIDATSSDEMFGWYIRISGVDTSNPIDVSNFTQSSSSSTSHVIPAITTTVADTLAIYGLAFDGGDGDPFSISGSGWSETAEQASGTTGNDTSGSFGSKSMVSVGSTGNATVGTSASDGAAYFQLAIRTVVVDTTNPTVSTLSPTDEISITRVKFFQLSLFGTSI